MMEGDGSSEMEYTEINTNAESLDNSVIFHVIKDVLGFVLYMHQQIPSVLQDIGLEFDSLKEEYQELEMALAQDEAKASIRRKHNSRKREVKSGIKRLEKLMNTLNGLESALQLIISEIPSLESFILILGASPLRPQHVYELWFSHGKVVLRGANDFTKSKAAEGLSRKAIRTLITKGGGSGSYPGICQIVPVRLRLNCKSKDQDMVAPVNACQTGSSINLTDSTSNEFIWFQCRHVVKGLVFATPTEE
ncbi:hypothetical protein JCGZ_21940 [Jatropha curcas]|uniref:Uncharacterized protein n=1 Tax=Jatropha curcas TaxID=180498 RepID=A0A067JPJ9_JATCU|nr:hypothetical protein JCGZ_21940 [Jatropha curcas]